MKQIVKLWQEDKLKCSLVTVWLLTVVSSFLGSEILSIHLPAIGAMYPFRFLLPLTALLYLVWAIREKHNPWKNASLVLRTCYILIAILLVYGAFSLKGAMDFSFTFRRLFNLCFDLCFFFLMLELCRDRDVLRATICVAMAVMVIMIPLGIYEVFCGGLINDKYDEKLMFIFFDHAYHLPVVTYSNANDYLSMLLFVFALAMMYWASGTSKQEHNWIPVALIPTIYFLLRSADSRLNLMYFWILLVGVIVYIIATKKKPVRLAAAILLLTLFVNFGNQYYQIKPAVQNYLTEIGLMEEQEKGPATAETPYQTNTFESDPLKDQFLDKNEETGELQLSTTQSAGIRVNLLIHAFRTFAESKGIGVGLGNTEQLAKIEADTKTGGIWNIHCFVARMIADFGVFFLIPLVIIGLGLVKAGIKGMIRGIRERNVHYAAFWGMYLLALVSYPFASTAPSDAQDIIAMWLYLGGMVLIPFHAEGIETR